MNTLTKKTKWMLFMTSGTEVLLVVLQALATYQGAVLLQFAQVGNWTMAARTLALCLGLLAVNAAVDLGNMAVYQKMFRTEVQALRSSILKSMFHRPIFRFREKDDGYYMNLLTMDTQTFCEKFLATIPVLVSWAARILAAAAMLYYLHPLLMVVTLAASALPIGFQKMFGDWSAKARNARSEAAQAFTAVMKETIEGYEAIRLDGDSENVLMRFEEFSGKERKMRSRDRMVSYISQSFFLTSASLVYLAGLGVSGWLIAQGKLDALMMLAGVNWIVQISNGFGNVLDYTVSIRSVRDIRKKLGRETKCEACQSDPLTETPQTLEYRNVDFSFGERKLLNQFSFTFRRGDCCGIIGSSGCGKSTLTKLCLQYYEKFGGAIFLGNREIRTLPTQAIYDQVGVLSQESFLFNASLYDNITMFSGRPARNSSEYAALLESVNLTELAERVGDAPLGDLGDKLSGGERQRICLARCFRREKPFYIFDEPTTGLDPENVQIIRQAIFSRRDAARIVISHDRDRAYLDQFTQVIQL